MAPAGQQNMGLSDPPRKGKVGAIFHRQSACCHQIIPHRGANRYILRLQT